MRLTIEKIQLVGKTLDQPAPQEGSARAVADVLARLTIDARGERPSTPSRIDL